jgi:hypothetical protein
MAAGRRRWSGRGGGGFRRGAAESTGRWVQVHFASGRRTKETRTVETPGPPSPVRAERSPTQPYSNFFYGARRAMVLALSWHMSANHLLAASDS